MLYIYITKTITFKNDIMETLEINTETSKTIYKSAAIIAGAFFIYSLISMATGMLTGELGIVTIG